MNGAFEEQVRQRAYEIWVDLGRSDGQAHDHWIAAERDLLACSAASLSAVKGNAEAAPAKTRRGAAKPSMKSQAAPKAGVKAEISPAALAKVSRPRKSAKSEMSGASA